MSDTWGLLSDYLVWSLDQSVEIAETGDGDGGAAGK